MRSRNVTFSLAVVLVFLVMVAGAQEKSPNRIVSERLITEVDFSSWIPPSFKVSPDSKRIAYVALIDNKWFVVLNGKEGRRYDGIVGIGGGRLIFDSPESLHYLAQKGRSIYLVEEKIE